MRKVRTLIAASAVLAVAGAAMGAPAAAAPGKGTIGLVNGVPGKGKVDLCINNKEIRGKAKYGGRAYRVLSPGMKKVRVFRADPRKCKGKLLGKKTISLAAGDDWTIVFTKKSPKFVMFSNVGGGDIPAAQGDPFPSAVWYWRHAADLGTIAMKYRLVQTEVPVGPAVDPVWTKGDQTGSTAGPGIGLILRATRPDKDFTLAKSPPIILETSYRYEWLLLGTTAKNAKFIQWIRKIVQP